MMIFITGEEFQAAQKLKELKEQFFNKFDSQGLNYTAWDNGSFDFSRFYQNFKGLSFFAPKRMFVIKRILLDSKHKADREQIQNKITEFESSEDIIVFFEPDGEVSQKKNKKDPLLESLSASKYCYHYQTLPQAKLVQWIARQAERQGTAIAASVAAYLANSCGDISLRAIASEIDKLCFYIKGQGRNKIEISDLSILHSALFAQTNIFSLIDALGAKNKPLALKLFNKLLAEDTEELAVFGLIAAQFRNLLIVKDWQFKNKNPKELYSILKLPPFVINKLNQQARGYSLEVLQKIYHSLLTLDKRAKTGGVVPLVYHLLFLGM